ncbi:2-isopropylmalate synthase [Dokdonella immobilis]|uniref:2-isopropylmalate synthase n=1 Tax=Dokdonella immobilis TaxID=578942 RepID=A0A1I4W1A1_9GAMM|nr:2-isopropylmalate synthase [Dokdonella immobilis]SFN07097.1 2-isopropylmalate synthase [Dokdonella immobilis]
MTSEAAVENSSEGKPELGQDRVLIFDTTLRDGEQAPGFSMSRAQKLRMASALADLGVDILEAGFPHASDDDFSSVRAIATSVRGPRICGLARCQQGDIESVARAIEPATKGRIHIFLATSPLHREFKLQMSRQQVIDTAVAGVERALGYCGDVEFSAEDAIRTEPDFLAEVFSAVIAAGATTVNVPDTVGYTTPIEIAERFAWLRANVRGAESVVFSAHCHDDLGMAVANSLAAISAGARQVECTINGIGERAGNAALEEIVMALRVRSDRFAGLTTGIRAKRLHATARLLAQITGQPIARNKAIIGENAFAHESGIHQHGMLKHRGTYEIMHAEDVGFARSQLVLGKHSGRHALRERLSMLGHELDEAALDEVFVQFKTLADRKREVFDADIEALAVGRDPEAAGPWHLSHLHATSHVDSSASASVRLTHDDGRVVSEAAIGDGPVDAVLRAVSRAVGHEFAVEEFHIRALSEGGDAQGQAAISVIHEGRELRGQAVSTDIVEAAAKAILEIANRIEHVAVARPTEPTAIAH